MYEFLGARDRISIRYRPVGHIPSNEDLLEFADHVFLDKPLSDEFGKLPYPEEKDGFDWDVAKGGQAVGPLPVGESQRSLESPIVK
jgi:hypothetical protein